MPEPGSIKAELEILVLVPRSIEVRLETSHSYLGPQLLGPLRLGLRLDAQTRIPYAQA